MNETTRDIKALNMNTTSPINTNGTVNITDLVNDNNEDVRVLALRYGVTGLMFLTVLISVVILVTIRRGKTNGFFQWKPFDRFAVYTVICDLVYYLFMFIFTAYLSFTESPPDGTLCTLIGLSVVQSSLGQSILTTVTSVFVFVLVVRNRNLSTGKNDWIIFLTVFGIPLVIVIAAFLRHLKLENVGYCDFIQEDETSADYFGLGPIIIVGSSLCIICLYLAMFCHVLWQKRRSVSVVNTSAVNTTRLAVKLSLLVVVHVIQFALPTIRWLLDEPSLIFNRISGGISVVGGLLNCVVYFAVRKR